MEMAILVFKGSAFIWTGWILLGYIAKAANSEPLADQRQGKAMWFFDVLTICAAFFIAFTEIFLNSVEAIQKIMAM